MKRLLLTAALLLPALAGAQSASVADQIAALEADKAARLARDEPLVSLGFPQHLARMAQVIRLQNGREVNMNDYAVVVFMQRACEYSAKFDPKLKAWSDENGVKVYPYTLDGYGDASFPNPLIPRKAGANEPLAGEILTFFGNGLPIATPTTFIVNVNTNAAYPLYQGDTDMGTLSGRITQMIEADLDNVPAGQLGPVPSGTGMTRQSPQG